MVVVGIAVAIGFLLLALRDTDPSRIASSFVDSDPRFLPLVAGALMLQFFFKALRWGILLRPFAGSSAVSTVMPATVVGYLANLVFPLYVGEIARAYLLGRQLDLPYSPVLATMVLERVFDFLSVLFFVGIVLIFDARAPDDLKTVGLAAAGASLLLITILAVFMRWTAEISALLVRIAALVSESLSIKLAEQIELGRQGLDGIRDPRTLPAIVLYSLLQWGAMGVCVFAGMLGTGIDAPLSAGFVVLALTVMAVTLPSSPGFFGTIQFCFTFGLAAYGIEASQAFAASVYFHLTIYVTGWMSGLYYLHRSDMTLGGLRQVSVQEPEISAETD